MTNKELLLYTLMGLSIDTVVTVESESEFHGVYGNITLPSDNVIKEYNEINPNKEEVYLDYNNFIDEWCIKPYLTTVNELVGLWKKAGFENLLDVYKDTMEYKGQEIDNDLFDYLYINSENIVKKWCKQHEELLSDASKRDIESL